MTDDEYRRRILAVETWANERTAILSTVPKRSHPSAGESNVLHDVAAAMAQAFTNRTEIEIIAATMRHLTECVEADFYGVERPTTEVMISTTQIIGTRLLYAQNEWDAREWSAP